MISVGAGETLLRRRSKFGRRLAGSVLLVVVLVFGAFGCSGGEADDADRASTPTTDPGVPSEALLAWASGYCRAEALPEGASPLPDVTTPTTLEPDPATVIAHTRDYLRQVAEYFEARAASTTALGPVPIEGGNEIAQHYVDSLQAYADDLAALADSVAAIDPAEPDALDRLAGALARSSELGFQLAGELALPARQDRPLQVAYLSAPDCLG